MALKITKDRRFDALKKTILFSAAIHLILLLIYSIIKRDFIYVNYFNMLDLELLFPDIIKGTLSQIFSAMIMATIYFVMYFFFTKGRKYSKQN